MTLHAYKPRRKRAHHEATLQATVVTMLRLFGAPNVIFYHPANEGARSPRTGARLKREGMLAGVADLALVIEGRAGFMELKTPTGRLSPEQKRFADACAASGALYAVARSPEEAAAVLHYWGALSQNPLRRAA